MKNLSTLQTPSVNHLIFRTTIIILLLAVSLAQSYAFLDSLFSKPEDVDLVLNKLRREVIDKYPEYTGDMIECVAKELRKLQGAVFSEEKFKEDIDKWGFFYTKSVCKVWTFVTTKEGFLVIACIVGVLLLIAVFRSCLCCCC
jgi:hypothetical protein